jgi:hypothetical protein
MSGYSYKGVPISTITYTTGGSSNTQFAGFPPTVQVPTGQNMSLPLTLGYQINQVDISNICTAASTVYNTNQTGLAIPANVKSVRVIALGGGGGRGGSGGDAYMDSGLGKSSASGKDGGDGGNGFYSYLQKTSVNYVNDAFNITIGNGGGNGNNGSNDNTGYPTASGGAGSTGGAGNSTVVSVGSNTITAAGGNAGKGGQGANIHWNSNLKFSYSFNGDAATAGNATDNNNSNYSSTGRDLNASNYGNGSNNSYYSNNGTVPAANSSAGAVQIIWLYD